LSARRFGHRAKRPGAGLAQGAGWPAGAGFPAATVGLVAFAETEQQVERLIDLPLIERHGTAVGLILLAAGLQQFEVVAPGRLQGGVVPALLQITLGSPAIAGQSLLLQKAVMGRGALLHLLQLLSFPRQEFFQGFSGIALEQLKFLLEQIEQESGLLLLLLQDMQQALLGLRAGV
jgi:hypothetical protein